MNENIFLLKKDKIWLCCKNSVFTCVYQRKEERRKLFSFLFKTRVNIVKKLSSSFIKVHVKTIVPYLLTMLLVNCWQQYLKETKSKLLQIELFPPKQSTEFLSLISMAIGWP